MRKSHWTPSIIPNDNDQTIYLVAEDFGKLGRAWREAEYEATEETNIEHLVESLRAVPGFLCIDQVILQFDAGLTDAERKERGDGSGLLYVCRPVAARSGDAQGPDQRDRADEPRED